MEVSNDIKGILGSSESHVEPISIRQESDVGSSSATLILFVVDVGSDTGDDDHIAFRTLRKEIERPFEQDLIIALQLSPKYVVTLY